MEAYPKRLIEVDLPIKRISAHARAEKDSRLSHIPRLHIYPAARPLAACRAVICAALWPDPVDEQCPKSFCEAARQSMRRWSVECLGKVSQESYPRFISYQKNPELLDSNLEVRAALLDFIADFANWDNATVREYLETSRALTQAAHEALGGIPGSRPIIVDSFAGGGAIPLEALRTGCDAFASDLNPVSITVNKVVLEYVPRHGEKLLAEVLKGVEWIQQQAKHELARFYLRDPGDALPIAYLWARTILSEGPGLGDDYPIEVPLLRTMWLARKGANKRALRWVRDGSGKVESELAQVKYADGTVRTVRRPSLEIFEPKNDAEVEGGTVKKTTGTCPITNFTTSAASVRKQLKSRNGGASDARLYCIVSTRDDTTGRLYRVPTERDNEQALAATTELKTRLSTNNETWPLLPDEPTPLGGGRGAGRAFGQRAFGMDKFTDLFTPRQLLALTTYARLARQYAEQISKVDRTLADAVSACLGLLVDRLADLNCSLCVWQLSTPNTAHVFGRWALQVVMDFGEVNPLAGAGGSPESALRRMAACLENLIASRLTPGHVMQCSADALTLPDNSAQAFITDPPYYDAIPYADLLDFFYVWLKRSLLNTSSLLHTSKVPLASNLTPKDEECIVDEVKGKDHLYFEKTMGQCLSEGRRVLHPSGIGVIVFAHKTTSGWESLLQAVVDAGWTIVGSWPIDTEMGSRLRAKKSAVLASSIHLVCRPRDNMDSSLRPENIGDWRDVLQELPGRTHEWMKRLAEEGVVGADAIFACLGPALEIFSRYSRVEKANGEPVMLKEYLEQVWAAVAKEALAMIFSGADTAAFEEDARLTAMWLWTLNAGNAEATEDDSSDEEDSIGEPGAGAATSKINGFVLEYDAARKIAQGLGAHLEDMRNLVEIKGESARLLPVAERARTLFGKEEGNIAAPKKKAPQFDLFKVLEQSGGGETTFIEPIVEQHGVTVLDRVHQSMILFAAGRSEAVKRFLVEEGVGRDTRFWSLAQALSALYPTYTNEKRWIDGVLARKKGLGF